MSKSFLLNCIYCGKNVVVRDAETLAHMQQYKQSPIPGGVPELNPETNKTTNKRALPRRPMYKCSNCGRGIVLKTWMVSILENQDKEDKIEEENNGPGRETGIVGWKI